MKKKCTRTTLKEEFDDLAALVVSSIRARERKKKTKRRRGDILKLSLSLSVWLLLLLLLLLLLVVVLKFFFFSILIMGSSRRRKKKHKSSSSSVRVGKVSQTRQFVEVKPLKLPSSRAEHAKESENETSWNKETSCVNNYSRNGLVSNANRFYYVGGRNALADNVKNMDDDENATRKRKAADETLTENSDRDELRKAVGERSSSGIAKPKRLTPRQKRICEMLMSKHGKDVEKMFRDIKANALQKTRGELKRMLESYEHYEDENGGDRIRVDFRAPKKRLSIKRAF